MADDDAEFAAITARLYGLPPDEFVAARDTEAKRAQGSLPGRVRALRRPTLAAWLVNLLAAFRSAELGELLAIGERLRDAQRSLEGHRVRELSTRRQEMITSLMESARQLAAEHGRKPRDDTVWEAETTLRAALADPELAAEIRAGVLVKAAEYSGLGLAPNDVPAAPIASEPAAPKPARTSLRVIPGGRSPKPRIRRASPATEPDTDARRRAEAALDKAEREREQATVAEHEAIRRLAEITAELEELRLRERRLRAQQSEVERAHRRAERRRRATEKAVAEARQRLR